MLIPSALLGRFHIRPEPHFMQLQDRFALIMVIASAELRRRKPLLALILTITLCCRLGGATTSHLSPASRFAFFRAGPLLSFLIPPLSDVFLWRCSFRGVRQDKKDWRKVGSGLRVVLLRRLYSFSERYAFFPYSPCPLLPCLSYFFCSFLLVCYMIYFNSCSLYAGIPLLLLYRTTMW